MRASGESAGCTSTHQSPKTGTELQSKGQGELKGVTDGAPGGFAIARSTRRVPSPRLSHRGTNGRERHPTSRAQGSSFFLSFLFLFFPNLMRSWGSALQILLFLFSVWVLFLFFLFWRDVCSAPQKGAEPAYSWLQG